MAYSVRTKTEKCSLLRYYLIWSLSSRSLWSFQQQLAVEWVMGGEAQNKHHVMPGIWRPSLSTALALFPSADPGCRVASLHPGMAEAATHSLSTVSRQEVRFPSGTDSQPRPVLATCGLPDDNRAATTVLLCWWWPGRYLIGCWPARTQRMGEIWGCLRAPGKVLYSGGSSDSDC